MLIDYDKKIYVFHAPADRSLSGRDTLNFDNDFISNYGGSCRWIWLAADIEPSSLSVMLNYDFDGEETCSDVVTLDLTGSYAEGIGASAEVAAEEYYDLSGRRINRPARGVSIVKRTMTDGSVRTAKSIR